MLQGGPGKARHVHPPELLKKHEPSLLTRDDIKEDDITNNKSTELKNRNLDKGNFAPPNQYDTKISTGIDHQMKPESGGNELCKGYLEKKYDAIIVFYRTHKTTIRYIIYGTLITDQPKHIAPEGACSAILCMSDLSSPTRRTSRGEASAPPAQLSGRQGFPVLPSPAGKGRTGNPSGWLSFAPRSRGKKLSQPLGLQGSQSFPPQLGKADRELHGQLNFAPSAGGEELSRAPVTAVCSQLLGIGNRLQATRPAQLLISSQRRKPFGTPLNDGKHS
uniref:Uncharacterized protein n=1 Tax=Sphaerodactylus townsendi TaxID=933632 RepID=A0ACB8ES70_9SAUR